MYSNNRYFIIQYKYWINEETNEEEKKILWKIISPQKYIEVSLSKRTHSWFIQMTVHSEFNPQTTDKNRVKGENLD